MAAEENSMRPNDARRLAVEMLLDKIRDDKYPSATHMSIVEEMLPREMVPEYLEILVGKVAADRVPSVPMLKRIQRVADSLPRQ